MDATTLPKLIGHCEHCGQALFDEAPVQLSLTGIAHIACALKATKVA